MTNAEHLIENAIFALKQNKDIYEVLGQWPNNAMLKETKITKDEIVRMAGHVVYSLYEGKYPRGGPGFEYEYDTEPEED